MSLLTFTDFHDQDSSIEIIDSVLICLLHGAAFDGVFGHFEREAIYRETSQVVPLFM
jgi:hypothetical protein